MSCILIIEDEPRVAAFIQKGLRAHGFTTILSDGQDAVSLALDSDFDLAILDLGLPMKDGLSILQELRGQGAHLPIIILTARDDIQDKVSGFELGANDYMTKPFHFEELLARVRVRLQERTSKTGQEGMVLQMGNVILDLRTRRVQIDHHPVELSAREFTLLETLMRHPNQVMSREQLLDRVWGYDYSPGSNIVDVYIGYLRKKLNSELIETVRGMGYRLCS
ncbi:MAG: response regulator transcription factor [Cyanothece sp. SIO1E1]|nr:response regulator transcription factor [Cyanothece sp. SIO1E1]